MCQVTADRQEFNGTPTVELKYHAPVIFNQFFILSVSSDGELFFLALTPSLPGQ